MKPTVNGVNVLEAIANLFTRDGIKPRVVINPGAGPSYNSAKHVISLPGVRTDDLSDEEQTQLNAFFWHEAQGEHGYNDYHADPRIDTPQRHMLANGVGDGYIDGLILADRPGAGLDIRTQVQIDCDRLLAGGAGIKPTVGVAACLARYLVEGVTDWPAIRAALTHPAMGPFLGIIQPVMPTRPRITCGADVVALTLKLDDALNNYRKGNNPEGEPSGPEGQPGKGQGKGKGAGKPEGQPQPSDSEAEGDEGPSDISLDNDGEGDNGEAGEPAEGEEQPGKGQGKGEPAEGDSGEAGEEGEPAEGDSGPAIEGENDGGNGPGSPTGESRAPAVPRDLDEGEDSAKRIADRLADMLTGKGQGEGAGHARTFHESKRAVVLGADMDRYLTAGGALLTYRAAPAIRQAASVLLVRLRAALTGPSFKVERGQEYGRLDPRRLANARAGSRTVYTRRREIVGDTVAVSVAWDESGSMKGVIGGVKTLVETMALALGQMPEVATEFTGWTTGTDPEELYGQPSRTERVNLYGTLAHTANEDVCHRVYKAFAEAHAALGPRLKRITSRSGTPMVEGLGWSARRLAAREETRKILFFLTDGQAYGDDISESAPWGYNALKYEVDRAHASGVTVIVFGIGMARDAGDDDATGVAYMTDTQRARHYAMLAQNDAANRDAQAKAWGSNAHVVLLPSKREAIVSEVTRSLLSVVTKANRR